MEHHSIEERIDQLERRLQASPAPSRHAFRDAMKTQDGRMRFYGWACTAFALVGFISGWGIAIPLVGLFFACALIIGLVLVASASGYMGHSDSYLELAKEARAHKKIHAKALHHRASISGLDAQMPIKGEHIALSFGFLILALLVGWAMTLSSNNALLEIALPAFILMIGGLWGVFRSNRFFSLGSLGLLTLLLFVAANPLIALMSGLTAFAVIWMAAWEERDTDILALSGFGLSLVAFGQVYWQVAHFSDAERVAAIAAGLMGVVLTALAYAPLRRTLERRDLSRVYLVISPIAALATITAAGPYTALQNLLAGLLLVVVGYAGMAYVGWLSNNRLSYAKYFLTVALAGLLLFVYLYLDPVSVALIWFILAVVVSAAGFTLPSYTARLLGLALVAVAVCHYLFTILGAPQVAGPILLRDRVWLGLVIGIFLPALGLWYQEMKVQATEKKLAQVVALGLSTAGFLILFAIGYLDIPVPYQSLLWLLVSLSAIGYGRYTKLDWIMKGGFVLIILSAIKLIGFDIFTLSVSDRLVGLLVVALILIILGFTLPKRSWRKGLL